MKTKIWLSVVLLACLAALPLCAQSFPGKGDDTVASFGKFWILIDPKFQPLFAGCPGFSGNVLESPPMYDRATSVIGRSAPLKAGSPHDTGSGVQTGSANTMIADGTRPPGFATVVANSNEVHTELRHLFLSTWPPVPPANEARVRAGVCYNSPSPTCSSPPPPNRISNGEVVSNAGTPGFGGTTGTPPDFPARSYFNVFARIDIPACPLPAHFPATTVQNKRPLLVQTASLAGFPPSGVVYLHDSSSAVGVRFLTGGHAGN